MIDASPTTEQVPPKPAPLRMIVRLDTDGQQVRVSDKEGHTLLHTTYGRVSCRLKPNERVAFFQGEIEAGILEIGERAPVEKHWQTPFERGLALPAAPPRAIAKPVHVPSDECPCGAPRHQGECRNAIGKMKGTWYPRGAHI